MRLRDQVLVGLAVVTVAGAATAFARQRGGERADVALARLDLRAEPDAQAIDTAFTPIDVAVGDPNVSYGSTEFSRLEIPGLD